MNMFITLAVSSKIRAENKSHRFLHIGGFPTGEALALADGGGLGACPGIHGYKKIAH